MIASWMLHAVLVTLLLGLAARAAEGALRAYRLPVRWAWLGAAVGALALPAAAATDLGRRVADFVASSAAAGGGTVGLGSGGPAGAIPPPTGGEGLGLPALPAAVEPVALALWIGGSLVLGALSLRTWWRLRRRRADWQRATVEGETVLVSEETGPASIGLLDPVLVLPRWVLKLPSEARRMVVRHEVEHREAGDSIVLTLGVAALVAAPWNPALWWVVRRLRLAVELDCDRRVLADGTAPGDYGALLLEITRGRRVQPIPAAALGPRRSQLERRIRAMTDSTPRFRIPRTALLALVAAGLLVAACDAPTPSEEPTATGPEATTSREADSDPPRGHGSLELGAEGSPLVVVDGERVDVEGALDDLTPSEIATIEVLKGPAAVEAYGEGARDGVIRITTKAAAGSGG